MYPANFVTFEGDRYDVVTNVTEGKTRTERVSDEAVGRFIRNTVFTAESRTIPAATKEVSE